MEALRRNVEEANKRVLMAQAESENFRKRMRRDYEDQIRFASLGLIADVLQVRDNLLRACDAASTADRVDSLREGVTMVTKQLDDVLKKYGVTPIDNSSDFDPHVHEAISQMPSPNHPPGKIAHVAVAGFMLHERVIRPSQVIISTGPS
jgi:molecular chaperone GrpE